eukprot:TRINITY_DN19453_c0_g1_i1.p1 TRINITY_DN19453_c0_g1~~TRINITY_DN19453_c0_g1_i1.p1  ORF type:complete len:561 (+),score=122.00 TRINITY_DN19453_c0_g1_i1:144-1685(+)
MNRNMVGAAPLLPSSCTGEMAHALLEVDGEPMKLVLDTGSSNSVIASSACSSCSISPKVSSPVGKDQFDIAFGTGAVIVAESSASLSMGGLSIPSGSFGAIVAQNTSFGFNVFAPVEDKDCYNSFAGLLGLAYMGQDAGPAANGGTTNGTTMPLLDQFVARGMPNAFALELCDDYPPRCDAHRLRQDTWRPSSRCERQQVGSLLLGGYSTARIDGRMQFVPLTDEVHYDIQLLGVRACGARGCERVRFPDRPTGRTEKECVCSSDDCAPGTVSYCSFTVVDSGTDAVYMNSAANAVALLNAMDTAGMVVFGDSVNSEERRAFWFNASASPSARLAAAAALEFEFAGEAGQIVRVPMSLRALFRETAAGVTQAGISGDLDLLAQFQRSKFPTLLGGSFFQGKTIFFDRSRRRLGFAAARAETCRQPASAGDIDVLARDARPTPGAGCRRGTGSGGGCNRGPWKSHVRSRATAAAVSASRQAQQLPERRKPGAAAALRGGFREEVAEDEFVLVTM